MAMGYPVFFTTHYIAWRKKLQLYFSGGTGD
jgi:hypothetical protein